MPRDGERQCPQRRRPLRSPSGFRSTMAGAWWAMQPRVAEVSPVSAGGLHTPSETPMAKVEEQDESTPAHCPTARCQSQARYIRRCRRYAARRYFLAPDRNFSLRLPTTSTVRHQDDSGGAMVSMSNLNSNDEKRRCMTVT